MWCVKFEGVTLFVGRKADAERFVLNHPAMWAGTWAIVQA